MAKPKQMDPDRYQMKDIKRRLSAVERFYQKQDAALQRINLRLKRRITHLESWADGLLMSNSAEE